MKIFKSTIGESRVTLGNAGVSFNSRTLWLYIVYAGDNSIDCVLTMTQNQQIMNSSQGISALGRHYYGLHFTEEEMTEKANFPSKVCHKYQRHQEC